MVQNALTKPIWVDVMDLVFIIIGVATYIFLNVKKKFRVD